MYGCPTRRALNESELCREKSFFLDLEAEDEGNTKFDGDEFFTLLLDDEKGDFC